MLIIALGWVYVVLLMVVAEATSPQGSWLSAIFMGLGYGVLPIGLLAYFASARARRQAPQAPASIAQPDGGRHAPGDSVASERKEP